MLINVTNTVSSILVRGKINFYKISEFIDSKLNPKFNLQTKLIRKIQKKLQCDDMAKYELLGNDWALTGQ